MFSSTRTTALLAVTTTALIAGGCSSTKLDERAAPAPIATVTAPTDGAQPAAGARPVTPEPTASAPLDPLGDAGGSLGQRSIYFDLDQVGIREEYVAVITAHGRYLGMHHDRHVVIEGNSDERGSREYNLALGRRRADAVKQRLVLLGALDRQAETVSFGEEKPRAAGHDEQAWAQNRRVDIVYR